VINRKISIVNTCNLCLEAISRFIKKDSKKNQNCKCKQCKCR